MNPEDSAYFPCEVCPEDTEHYLSEYYDWNCVEWECADCGPVLKKEVFRRFLDSLPVSIWVIHQDQRRDKHGLSTVRRYRP